jgi:hypothetical protein
MQTDPDHATVHQSIQSLIDKSLAGDASTSEESTIREHLEACDACRHYQAISQRTIASLKGFSFGKGPEARDVVAALMAKSGEFEATKDHQQNVWIGCLIGALLTISGSFTATRVVRLLSEIFPLPSVLTAERVHFGLMAFWVLPSIFICLLFLLLPNLSSGWLQKKGLSI